MKSLKLDHILAEQVRSGQKTSTWRINDDKDLHVNDQVTLVDKQDPNNPASWQPFGTAIITSILEKQLGQVEAADMDGQKYASMNDILKEYRGYYGQQVGLETPVKIIHFIFTPMSTGQTSTGVVRGTLFSDGGSRGNPGPSACGYVLYDADNRLLAENGVFLGVTTNNQAEYQSLKLGMEEALKKGITNLDVFMDSMLVINQMKGAFKVKNQDLRAIHSGLVEVASKFAKITFTHVPRERNRRADAIVNEVLDSAKQ